MYRSLGRMAYQDWVFELQESDAIADGRRGAAQIWREGLVRGQVTATLAPDAKESLDSALERLCIEWVARYTTKA